MCVSRLWPCPFKLNHWPSLIHHQTRGFEANLLLVARLLCFILSRRNVNTMYSYIFFCILSFVSYQIKKHQFCYLRDGVVNGRCNIVVHYYKPIENKKIVWASRDWLDSKRLYYAYVNFRGKSTCNWHKIPGRGALPKNRWRGCVATSTPTFRPPVTEWPPFYFSHFALT